MDFTTIAWLIVGAIAGGMVGKILKRTFWGAVGDAVIGMAGGFAGAWLWTHAIHTTEGFDWLGFGWFKALAAAAAGGIVLVVAWRIVRAMR